MKSKINGGKFYLLPTYRNSLAATLVSVFANIFCIFTGIVVIGMGFALGSESFGSGNVASGLGTVVLCALIGTAIIFLGVKLRTVAYNIAVNKIKKQQGE